MPENRIKAYAPDGRTVTLRRVPIDQVPPGELDDVLPDQDPGDDLEGGPERPKEAPVAEQEDETLHTIVVPTAAEREAEAEARDEQDEAAIGHALLTEVLRRITRAIDPALTTCAQAVYDEALESIREEIAPTAEDLADLHKWCSDSWEIMVEACARQDAIEREMATLRADAVQEARAMLRAELATLRSEIKRSADDAVARVLESVKVMLAAPSTKQIEYDEYGRPARITQAPGGAVPDAAEAEAPPEETPQ